MKLVKIGGLLAAFFIVGCGSETGNSSTSTGSELCPGGCKKLVLDHLEQQKSRVASGPGNSYCRFRANKAPGFVPSPPRVVNTIKDTNTPDKRQTDAYPAYLFPLVDRWEWGGDRAAGRRAIDFIYRWASANALSTTLKDGKDNSRSSDGWWTSYGVMASTMNALFLLDDHPDFTPEKRTVIWNWLDGLVKRSWILGQLPKGGAGSQDREQRVNNHNARRAVILLYYGIHKDDQALIRKSLRDVQRSYNAIDSAGVPYDANRGNWALNYVNTAFDSMTTHAAFMETVSPGYLAANQPLMSKFNAGTAFLFEEVRSPNRIDAYARANIGRGDTPYLGKLDNWSFRDITWGVTWWGWVDNSVIKRLPAARAEVQRSMSRHPIWGRAKHTEVGGNVTCWFR